MSRLFDDGSNEYLYRAGAAVAAVPLTMAVWVRKDDGTNGAGLMTIADESVNNHYFQLQYWTDEIVYAGANGGAGLKEAGSTAAGGIDTWEHACGCLLYTSPSPRDRS